MLADLTPDELRILDALLPEHKPFYANVKAKLDALMLRRLDDGSIEFGDHDDELADTVAIGETQSPTATVLLRMDDAGVGARFILPEIGSETKLAWTLSSWIPGDKSVREIEMKDVTGKLYFVFALSAERRVLWLHHVASGYNQLLPVTGLLVELARLKLMPSTGRLTHEAFFELVDRSSDDILMEALLAYNARARKFNASDVSIHTSPRKDRGFFNIFRK